MLNRLVLGVVAVLAAVASRPGTATPSCVFLTENNLSCTGVSAEIAALTALLNAVNAIPGYVSPEELQTLVGSISPTDETVVGPPTSITVSIDISPSETTTLSSIPEPASLAVFGVGLLGLGVVRRRVA